MKTIAAGNRIVKIEPDERNPRQFQLRNWHGRIAIAGLSDRDARRQVEALTRCGVVIRGAERLEV